MPAPFASAVGLSAIPDAGDLDGALVLVVEEHPVIATPEPETGQRGLELLHVANTVGQVAIHTVENLHGGLALDGAQIGAGFRRPDAGDSLGVRVLAHFASPNSRRISSWGMPSPRASDARAHSNAAAVSGVISSSSTRSEERRVGKEWRTTTR